LRARVGAPRREKLLFDSFRQALPPIPLPLRSRGLSTLPGVSQVFLSYAPQYTRFATGNAHNKSKDEKSESCFMRCIANE
jgi:hypothetical protein